MTVDDIIYKVNNKYFDVVEKKNEILFLYSNDDTYEFEQKYFYGTQLGDKTLDEWTKLASDFLSF